MFSSLARPSALAATLLFGLPAALPLTQAHAENASASRSAETSQSDLWNLAVGPNASSTGHATREDRLADFRRAQAARSLGSGSITRSRSLNPSSSSERRSPRAFVQHHGAKQPVRLSSGSTSGLRSLNDSASRSRGAVNSSERRRIVVTPRNDIHLKSGFQTHAPRRIVSVPSRGFHTGRNFSNGQVIVRGNTRGVTLEQSPSFHQKKRAHRAPFSLGHDRSRSSFQHPSLRHQNRFDRGFSSQRFRSSSRFQSRSGHSGFHGAGASLRLKFGGH